MPDNPWVTSDFGSGRLRVNLDDASAAPLAAVRHSGQVWHFAASSPVHTVEWKWPLSLAFAPGSTRLRQSIQRARATDADWRRSMTRMAEGCNSDILFVASGTKPLAALKASPVPLTCDLLILCGVAEHALPAIAACANELLALTQANAILSVPYPATETTWFYPFIEELSHNFPVDFALARLSIPGAALWSTEEFLRQAVLSNFLDPLKRRIRRMAVDLVLNSVDMPALTGRILGKTTVRLPAGEAIRLLNVNHGFVSES
ncbi:MAG: hypothetical protein IH602_05070, partial [Bryobacteraceae bacterium]|nr:hypothetical protein [Bryobacteraceae bacterium]